MLYFSYGSFLDSETLSKHCPKAAYICKAILPNWEVQFNFLSSTYKRGVTEIEPATARPTRGVLYEVNDVKAATYRTTNPGGPFKPTKRYLGLMIKGAIEHSLDPNYVKGLSTVETVD